MPATKRRLIVPQNSPSQIQNTRFGSRGTVVESRDRRVAIEEPEACGLLAEVFAKEGIEVHTHPVEGDPAEAILEVAEETKADLIVVGNKGMTGARRGRVSSEVREAYENAHG